MVSNTTQPSLAHFLPTSPHRVCFIVRPSLDDSSNYNLQQAKRDLLTWNRLNSELCTGVTALFADQTVKFFKNKELCQRGLFFGTGQNQGHSSKTEKSYVQNCVLKKYFNITNYHHGQVGERTSIPNLTSIIDIFHLISS